MRKVTVMSTESKVLSIAKSFKFEGCVMVTPKASPDKLVKRNYYLDKVSGKQYCYFSGDIYSFKLNTGSSLEAYDIEYEGRYSGDAGSWSKGKAETPKKVPAVVVEVPKAHKVVVETEGVKHAKYQQILTCVSVDIPVYLYGPAGSGKNHTLQQIAESLGLDFYFTNSVQQEYKITGFVDAGGKYHETEFYKAFVNGGLFFLDEMDASIPEVLVLLNAALANKYFEFPNGKVNAHKDFRVVAAGNTVGNGADEQYTGRLQLDQATLDRFVLIEFDYDENIELALAKGNTELVEFVRGLRKQASEKGIRATFSYRCIITVTKLEGKMELKEIIAIGIMKGFDKDTVNTFETDRTNKYSQALFALKKGA